MNIIKQFASRVMVFGLAIAILGTGLVMSGDNNAVEAETLSSLYLTNKGTGYTTEASPPSARSAPSSRKNASTVYVTMSDVTTANAVKNSHIINANKVVITVVEPDYNTKVAATSADPNASGPNAIEAVGGNINAWGANTTHVLEGSAGNPVIDSDSDGVLDDEVNYGIIAEGSALAWNGTAWSDTVRANSDKILTVSVANGDSATNTATKPMITAMITTAITGVIATDDVYVGYYTSAVNTFQVKAWSTVQLESNGSIISVVETGRNTGVFEAEFLVADTEGVNDNVTEDLVLSANSGAATNTTCGTTGGAAGAGTAGAADGRYDASGGVNADCELLLAVADQDIAAADIAQKK